MGRVRASNRLRRPTRSMAMVTADYAAVRHKRYLGTADSRRHGPNVAQSWDWRGTSERRSCAGAAPPVAPPTALRSCCTHRCSMHACWCIGLMTRRQQQRVSQACAGGGGEDGSSVWSGSSSVVSIPGPSSFDMTHVANEGVPLLLYSIWNDTVTLRSLGAV